MGANYDATACKMIKEFKGSYRWLSNFWPAEIKYEGIVYPATEHAYQAAKFLDKNKRLRISKTFSPAEAKRMGQDTKDRRPDWFDVSLKVMYDVNLLKYGMHSELGEMLVETFPQILQEGNTWGDTFWGICKGKGENHLGKILMKVRDVLRKTPVDQRWMLVELCR